VGATKPKIIADRGRRPGPAGAAQPPSILHAFGVRRSGIGSRIGRGREPKEAPMSQITLKSDAAAPARATAPISRVEERATPVQHYEDVAIVLAKMTASERVRAYETGVFTLRELNGAARVRPDLAPIVNGEFEWIALNAE